MFTPVKSNGLVPVTVSPAAGDEELIVPPLAPMAIVGVVPAKVIVLPVSR